MPGPTTSETTGPKPTDELLSALIGVCEEANYSPFTVQSNFARKYAPEVAAAASLGLLTTRSPDGYGTTWRPTLIGQLFLETGRL